MTDTTVLFHVGPFSVTKEQLMGHLQVIIPAVAAWAEQKGYIDGETMSLIDAMILAWAHKSNAPDPTITPSSKQS